ncbi:class I adenylate-forming enzyme family protein [Algihabitans albus]|uniref:class I adenylate-forming enzyme family protein n=1 Tax=Algihabitans albus TaxID=2164067 RepID=UPI000E5DA16F|nr:class I adenylate-forming enzyme family protein [Algihabitans albus]
MESRPETSSDSKTARLDASGAQTYPATDRPRAVTVPGETFLNLTEAVRCLAAARPDHLALIDGDQRLTWRDLGSLVGRVTARLRSHGLRRGTMVASLAENSAAHVAVYLGALGAGACMVPLPTGAHEAALGRMALNCDPALLFASINQSEVARRLGPSVVDLDDLETWLGEAIPDSQENDLPEPVGPDDLFDMIYSSGTTGTPKGILHDHRFRSRQVMRMANHGLNGDAICLMSTPLYSNTTLVAVLPVLAYGGTLVVMRKFETQGFLRLAERHRVSHAMLVPVQYRRILDDPDFGRFDLSAFRVKLSTSAPLPAATIRAALTRWPGKLIEIYGMTEGGISTMLDCAAHPDKLDTVGQPVAGAEVRILDSEERPLPPGEIGEVVGRSPTMMVGYHKSPESTAVILWRSPEGEDFLRTGDMGRLDADGFLTLLDRRKDMILSGGFNIYAADLEQVLLAHPDVAEAAVIAVPSHRWGETPLGLVALGAGATVSAEALRDWANAHLGKTQRLAAVEIRESLPRNAIGKVLKRELRAPYWLEATT